MTNAPVIAMTREMGTLGEVVARRIAERLELEVIHPELVEMSAALEAQPAPSEVERHLTGLAPSAELHHGRIARGGFRTPAQILEIAARGGVIIRGWGATRLLRPIPHVLCVRIQAPMEFRVEQMVARLRVDAATARREIARSDASHTNAFWRLFESDWRKADDYDLVLNTAHLGVDTCTDLLANALRNPLFRETEVSRRKLEDRLLSARLEEVLHAREDIAHRARYVHSGVSNGTVTLWGAVNDGGARGELEKLVSELPGVRSVRNEIHPLGSYSNS